MKRKLMEKLMEETEVEFPLTEKETVEGIRQLIKRYKKLQLIDKKTGALRKLIVAVKGWKYPLISRESDNIKIVYDDKKVFPLKGILQESETVQVTAILRSDPPYDLPVLEIRVLVFDKMVFGTKARKSSEDRYTVYQNPQTGRVDFGQQARYW